MKKISLISFLAVLVAPLLMATQCAPTPPGHEYEVGCEMDCEVWVKYVDKNGYKIKFGTGDYSKPKWLHGVNCGNWTDLETQQSLHKHSVAHSYYPNHSIPDSAHMSMLAAPARDSLTHPRVKGKLNTMLFYDNGKIYGPESIYDDIEVYLHYDTPDKAYITLIKINGETKWDRSKLPQEELSKNIVIDVYIDPSRLK